MTPEQEERERRRKQALQTATAGLGQLRGDELTQPEERFDNFALDGDPQWSPGGVPQEPTYNPPPTYGDPEPIQLPDVTVEARPSRQRPTPVQLGDFNVGANPSQPSPEMQALLDEREVADAPEELVPQEAGDPPGESERGTVTYESIMADRPDVVTREYAPGESQADYPDYSDPPAAPWGEITPSLREAMARISKPDPALERRHQKNFRELAAALQQERPRDIEPPPPMGLMNANTSEGPETPGAPERTGAQRLAAAQRKDRLSAAIQQMLGGGALALSGATNRGNFAQPQFMPTTYGRDMQAVLAQEGREAAAEQAAGRQGSQDELARARLSMEQERLGMQRERQDRNADIQDRRVSLAESAEARQARLSDMREEILADETAANDHTSHVSQAMQEFTSDLLVQSDTGVHVDRNGEAQPNAALLDRIPQMSAAQLQPIAQRILTENLQDDGRRGRARRRGGGGGGAGGTSRRAVERRRNNYALQLSQQQEFPEELSNQLNALDMDRDRWANSSPVVRENAIRRALEGESLGGALNRDFRADRAVSSDTRELSRRHESFLEVGNPFLSFRRAYEGLSEAEKDAVFARLAGRALVGNQLALVASDSRGGTVLNLYHGYNNAHLRYMSGAAVTEPEEVRNRMGRGTMVLGNRAAFEASMRATSGHLRSAQSSILGGYTPETQTAYESNARAGRERARGQ